MSFADAWHDVHAFLDGVEAKRADLSSEFLLGLQTREFIPVLRQRFTDVVERWPWDVIIGSEAEDEPRSSPLREFADLTIGLGPGYVAGDDCDLVIETEGPDPGAIVRKGPAPRRRARLAEELCLVTATASGVFCASRMIGVNVEADEVLGHIGDSVVRAPVGGRIKGMARREQAVIGDEAVAEIALSRGARVAGVSESNQLVSRGVAFAIEMELEGWAPFPIEGWG